MAEMGRRDAQRIVRGLTVLGKEPVVLLSEVLAALEPGRHAGGQYRHPFQAVQCHRVAHCGPGLPGVLCVPIRRHVIVSADRASCTPGTHMMHGALQAAQASACTAPLCLCVAVLPTVA